MSFKDRPGNGQILTLQAVAIMYKRLESPQTCEEIELLRFCSEMSSQIWLLIETHIYI